MSEDTLTRLSQLIRSRRSDGASTSYTRQLLDGGATHCARKLGEEAIETVIAALAQDQTALKMEAADLLYHLLVLLEVREVPLSDVLAELDSRTSRSGLDEKAARAGG